MRDGLANLIISADTYDTYECKLCTKADSYCKVCGALKLADHLIANGAILPPCKVGDRIWDKYGYTFEIQKIEIFNDIMLFRCGNRGTEDYMAFYDFEVGTNVFLTKEDAEKALKEKENETEII